MYLCGKERPLGSVEVARQNGSDWDEDVHVFMQPRKKSFGGVEVGENGYPLYNIRKRVLVRCIRRAVGGVEVVERARVCLGSLNL